MQFLQPPDPSLYIEVWNCTWNLKQIDTIKFVDDTLSNFHLLRSDFHYLFCNDSVVHLCVRHYQYFTSEFRIDIKNGNIDIIFRWVLMAKVGSFEIYGKYWHATLASIINSDSRSTKSWRFSMSDMVMVSSWRSFTFSQKNCMDTSFDPSRFIGFLSKFSDSLDVVRIFSLCFEMHCSRDVRFRSKKTAQFRNPIHNFWLLLQHQWIQPMNKPKSMKWFSYFNSIRCSDIFSCISISFSISISWPGSGFSTILGSFSMVCNSFSSNFF